MEYKDYYQTLGVSKTASEDEIKKAYRKLVRKYHPDVSKEADAQKKTQELNEAYGVLGDAEKRAAYDDLGRGRQYRAGQEFRPPPDWGRGFGGGTGNPGSGAGPGGGFGDTDSSDFFADLFANLGGRRRQQYAYEPQRGDDSHATITIDLADAYHGATRNISMMVADRDAADRIVTRERTLSVNIPKGVMAGQQLRLSGQGQRGDAGPGDLYLEIEFRPDPRYRVGRPRRVRDGAGDAVGAGAGRGHRRGHAVRQGHGDGAGRIAKRAQAAPARTRHSRQGGRRFIPAAGSGAAAGEHRQGTRTVSNDGARDGVQSARGRMSHGTGNGNGDGAGARHGRVDR